MAEPLGVLVLTTSRANRSSMMTLQNLFIAFHHEFSQTGAKNSQNIFRIFSRTPMVP